MTDAAPPSEADRIATEARRRRTFAIISHPDAGKTTLTEKLLLYGGAIHLAGSVKARRAARHATSDWMELEKQRGISVTTSVLSFPYGGCQVNLLDTPGHKDFSEDTYRTLAAADSAVMLIDAAKGVEEQTVKLFKVCRMRGIPIFTFVNKLDRHGRDPLDLVDNIEKVLGIRSCPVNWPVGMGPGFRGVYDRHRGRMLLFDSSGRHGEVRVGTREGTLDDPELRETIGAEAHRRLVEEVEMLDLAGDPFDPVRVRAGELAPMFFGSAMTNFGVEPFLQAFLEHAPPPQPRRTTGGTIDPEWGNFSGFVFKIQANMDPAHRDRIAFVRVVSGRFERGMDAWHQRLGKTLRLAKSNAFLAAERTVAEEAFPGDVIGLFDPGVFRIGDTLSGAPMEPFEGIPRFSPEHFVRVRAVNAMKRKQLKAGLDQLSEEGAIQVFRTPGSGGENPVLGAVGALQFDVLQFRLEHEYGVEVVQDPLPFTIARWISGGPVDPREFEHGESSTLVEDKDGRPLALFRNDWALRWAQEHSKGLEFREAAGQGIPAEKLAR